METAESLTLPLTWHDFLERMRHPSASEFVKAIKSFIVSFSNNPRDPDRDTAAIQLFLANTEAAFRSHPLWAGRSDEELESSGEGLEKYVMTKLYPRVFASYPEDINVDDRLHGKSVLVRQFVQPEHLDIPATFRNEPSWVAAQRELQKINGYKAPRDKLACILGCCKAVANGLAASDGNRPGADEFLPVLIYVTIMANPPQLHSNLSYIQRFRRESRLVGEAAYFFTNMLSAEAFILNMDGKALSMDEEEFKRNMESAQAVVFGFSEDHGGGDRWRSQSGQSQSVVESIPAAVQSRNLPGKVPSVSDLENKGAGVVVAAASAEDEFRSFPYLYSRAEDLTVGDVERLVNDYKRLVIKYVCLAKGMGVPVTGTRNAPPLETSGAPEGKTGAVAEPSGAPEGQTGTVAEGKTRAEDEPRGAPEGKTGVDDGTGDAPENEGVVAADGGGGGDGDGGGTRVFTGSSNEILAGAEESVEK